MINNSKEHDLWMLIRLFLRESPFSNKWLSLFSFNEVIEYFDEIESIEVKMESLKEEIINDLEDLIGETSRFIWKLSLTLMNLTNAFKK